MNGTGARRWMRGRGAAKTAVLGVDAPGPRLTVPGAALMALAVALPVGGLIGFVDWLV